MIGDRWNEVCDILYSNGSSPEETERYWTICREGRTFKKIMVRYEGDNVVTWSEKRRVTTILFLLLLFFLF